MKKKCLKATLLCLFALVLALSGSIFGACAENGTKKAEEIAQGILSHQFAKHGCDTVESLINGALADEVALSEWMVLALYRYSPCDGEEYCAALNEYLDGKTSLSAPSRLKYALTLTAFGKSGRHTEGAVDKALKTPSVMNLTFALHLLNNGALSEEHTAATVCDLLLDQRRADGGWALSGASSNPDVTAMVIQALSPYYGKNEEITHATDGALARLSSMQSDSGEYVSYGEYNAESAAQVIIALSSLGIDAETDERFIKNGSTLFDVLQRYRLPSGAYSHVSGGAENPKATEQVLAAAVSYLRFKSGASPFFIFEEDTPPEESDTPSKETDTPSKETDEPSEETKPLPNEPETDKKDPEGEPSDSQNEGAPPTTDEPTKPQKPPSYKKYAYAGVIILGLVACVLLVIFKKRHVKNLLFVVFIALVCLAIVRYTDISLPEDYYGRGEEIESPKGTVTLSITCKDAVGLAPSEVAPEDGIILDVTELEIFEGETVYELLVDAARRYTILIENNGTSDMAYISGINNLYEFDCGDLSGWTFRVNGITPSVGCGEYTLSDGDCVEWVYTLDLWRGEH